MSQRQHERVVVDAFVRVQGAAREYVFRTRDISRTGLFLYTKVGHLYPFALGSELEIELYDFDGAVTLRAVVQRIVEPGTPEARKYPAGFAMRIVKIDEANGKRLDDLIVRAARGEDPY